MGPWSMYTVGEVWTTVCKRKANMTNELMSFTVTIVTSSLWKKSLKWHPRSLLLSMKFSASIVFKSRCSILVFASFHHVNHMQGKTVQNLLTMYYMYLLWRVCIIIRRVSNVGDCVVTGGWWYAMALYGTGVYPEEGDEEEHFSHMWLRPGNTRSSLPPQMRFK